VSRAPLQRFSFPFPLLIDISPSFAPVCFRKFTGVQPLPCGFQVGACLFFSLLRSFFPNGMAFPSEFRRSNWGQNDNISPQRFRDFHRRLGYPDFPPLRRGMTRKADWMGSGPWQKPSSTERDRWNTAYLPVVPHLLRFFLFRLPGPLSPPADYTPSTKDLARGPQGTRLVHLFGS